MALGIRKKAGSIAKGKCQILVTCASAVCGREGAACCHKRFLLQIWKKSGWKPGLYLGTFLTGWKRSTNMTRVEAKNEIFWEKKKHLAEF